MFLSGPQELLEVYELKKILLDVKKCEVEMNEKQQLVSAAETALHDEQARIGECSPALASVAEPLCRRLPLLPPLLLPLPPPLPLPLHAGPLEEELRELRKSQASRGRAHESAVAKWNAAEAKLKQCRNLATDTEEKLVGGEAPSHSHSHRTPIASHRIQLMEPTVFHDSRKPRLWIW